jgi:protein gp37
VSTSSKIEWTRGDDGSAGATWNPVTGCREVSEGCEHCYAKTFAERFRGVPRHPFEQGFDIRLWPERLMLPLRWRKAKRVFVNSMSDLFIDRRQVPDDFVARVFATMAATPQHTYQVLTKRPGRMASLLGDDDFRRQVAHHLLALSCDQDGQSHPRLLERASDPLEHWPLPNVWVGTSVESQRWAEIRIPKLIATPARIRFLSCEPLLSAVDLARWMVPSELEPGRRRSPIQWMIAGGESGPGARPMHPLWAQDLARVSRLGAVAFFHKQHGAWMPICAANDPNAEAKLAPWRQTGRRLVCLLADGVIAVEGDRVHVPPDETGWWLVRVGKGKAGRELLGRTWNEFPAASAAGGDAGA